MYAGPRLAGSGWSTPIPSVADPFLLVHNGTVPYFADIRPRLLEAMTTERRAAICQGRHRQRASGAPDPRDPCARIGGSLFASLEAALRLVIALCREIGQEPHLGLNVLLTDGMRMVGSRWRRTLHFFEQHGAAPSLGEQAAGATDYRALIIASEPIDGTNWPEIPERSVFEVTQDLRLQIAPLEEG